MTARRNLTLAEERAIEAIEAAARLRKFKADPERALANQKRRDATRRKNLADPAWGCDRPFVPWHSGMLTRDYVRRHQNLGSTKHVDYVFADRVAPWTVGPDAVEEQDL